MKPKRISALCTACNTRTLQVVRNNANEASLQCMRCGRVKYAYVVLKVRTEAEAEYGSNTYPEGNENLNS